MFSGEKNCLICGDVFLFTRHQTTKKYCSDQCHRKANRKKKPKLEERIIKHG
mgnify:CR=1 FL=1